jgi:hypothetical protein
MNGRAALMVLLVLVSASPGHGRDQTVRRLPSGAWGGRGVGLAIAARGATLEYDCAHGTIDRPIRLDRRGRFQARGTHILEHGGPEREGEALPHRPVRYAGRVAGETMSLTVTFADTGEGIGSFTLSRGREPLLRKCL